MLFSESVWFFKMKFVILDKLNVFGMAEALARSIDKAAMKVIKIDKGSMGSILEDCDSGHVFDASSQECSGQL